MYTQSFNTCVPLVLLALLAVLTQVVSAAPRSGVATETFPTVTPWATETFPTVTPWGSIWVTTETLAMTVPTQAPAPEEESDLVLHKRWKGPPLGFKCWARANCPDCPPKSDFKAPNGEWKTIKDPRGGLIFLFIDEVGTEYICESPQIDDRPKPYCKDTVTEKVVNGKIIRTHKYDLQNLPRGERNKLEAIRNGTLDGSIPEAEAKKLIKAFIARVCSLPGHPGGNGTMPTTTEHLVIGTSLATLVPDPTAVPTVTMPEPTAVPTFTMPQPTQPAPVPTFTMPPQPIPPPPETTTVPSPSTKTVIRTDVSTVTATHKPIVPSTSTVIQTDVSTITTTHTPIVPSTSTVIQTDVSTLTTTHTPSMTTTTKTYRSIVTETHVPIPPITITLTKTAPSGFITVTETKTEKETTSDMWTTVTLTRPRRPGTVITMTLTPSVITTTLSPSVVTTTLHSGASVITTTFDTEEVITSTADPEAWGTVSTATLDSGAAPAPTEESRMEEPDRDSDGT